MSSVCRWEKSFKDINKDYSDSFREHGINGHLLLTSVDDEVLRDAGESTVLHRKLFLKAIDELKEPSITSSSNRLSSLSKESQKSYYDEFRGDFAALLSVHDMNEAATSNYRQTSACQLDKIEFVFNVGYYPVFLGHIEAVENRQTQTEFQPKLHGENSFAERQRVLERLDSLCQQVSHNRQAWVSKKCITQFVIR